ncbi:hypothetical protein E6C64_02300 [Naasia lichenicola]|uniref:Uncharacterized protein n=1 Tax=Naasia lichenicola TaxID=2565933 RepID=A0A4S4FUC9_9MICO|nr:hypothetical protein E6C64_02300 [Naasia lichenicola]
MRTAIVAPSVALYTDPSAREPMNGPTPEPATLIYSAADAIGCTALVLDDIAAGYTSTTASCLLDGERVRLYEFPTAQAYSSFISELNRAGIQGLGLIRRGPVVFAPGPGEARAAVRAALEETAATH